MKKIGIVVLILAVFALGIFIGRTSMKDKQSTEDTEVTETTTATTEQKTTEKKTDKKKVKDVTLYIGSEADGYGKYNWPYTGDLTPQVLLDGISDTTGWDLSLSKRITKKSDGYIFCFSDKSVIYTGQKTDEQDEFYLPYDGSFYQTVLDSIAETMRQNLKKKGQDLNLYYWGPDDNDLVIEKLNITLKKDQPYEGLKEYQTQIQANGEKDMEYDLTGTFVGMPDAQTVTMNINGTETNYKCTYRALLAIFNVAESGREMEIKIKENVQTGEKLIIKIY